MMTYGSRTLSTGAPGFSGIRYTLMPASPSFSPATNRAVFSDAEEKYTSAPIALARPCVAVVSGVPDMESSRSGVSLMRRRPA